MARIVGAALFVTGLAMAAAAARAAPPPPAAGERHLSGRVVGNGGGGVAGVRIRVVRASQPSSGLGNYRTDAEGRFDAGGLADEEHVLEVYAGPNYTDLAPVRVRAGAKDLVVVLRAAVTVNVSVLDVAGSPVPGAFIVASGSSPAAGSTRSAGTTDASGVAKVEGLAPDVEYRLQVEFPDDDTKHEDARIDRWKPRNETLRVAEARRLVGTVRDPAGRPLGGISVSIPEGRGRSYGPPPRWRAWSAPDGTFAFHRVPRGELTIDSHLVGDRRMLPSTTRVSADATTVDVVFDPGRALAVRFENLGDPGKGRGHTAILRGDDAIDADYRHEYEIPKEGKVVFHGLEDGARYRLVVTAVAGMSAAREDLRAGDDVTVALVRGGTVRGRVRAPRAIDRVSVWVGGSPSIAAGETDANGAFVLEGIPEGRWRIHALTWFGEQGFGADAAVEPGDEIELTLEPR